MFGMTAQEAPSPAERQMHLRFHSFGGWLFMLPPLLDTPASYHALFPVGKVVWEPDTRGRTPCQLTMYFWHVMFGEELWLPRRHRDTRLPLFIRMLNIEAEAVVEAQRGEDGPAAAVIQFTGDDTGADDTYYRLQSLFSEADA